MILRRHVSARSRYSSPCAFAQDGVTLYGLIDQFAQYVNTGNGYTAALGSSGQWASRIGLKGGEDIGGGNQIRFVLENGFNPTDGSLAQPGTLFNRQAWVGVSGAWGQVRAGRQNSPVFIDQSGQDAFAGVTQASGMDNLTVFAFRTSNTISYMTPEVGGFQAGVFIGLGDAGGLRSAGSSYQFDVTYEHGPFAAFVAGQWLKNATNTTTDHAILAGTSYTLGKHDRVRRLFGFEVGRYRRRHARIWLVGQVSVQSGELCRALGYTILRDQSGQHDNADQLGLMVEYDVSKRTNVYGALSFLRNRNQAKYTLAGAANAGLPLAYPGADARGVQVGVVHRF